MATDYSTSKFENELAERAYNQVLDGMSGVTDSLADDEGTVLYDYVHVYEGGSVQNTTEVILRYESSGFVCIEAQGSAAAGRWSELEKEHESVD